jgi:hypothetical protein
METMKRGIAVSLELAKSLLGKDEAMDMLIKSNFTAEELGIKPKLPEKWEELGEIKGYFLGNNSSIQDYKGSTTGGFNSNLFKTEKQAKAALAMAKLSQLMHVYNEGWEPDWSNRNQYKVCIERKDEEIALSSAYGVYGFLTFRDERTAWAFRANFMEDIRAYYEMD